MALKRGDLDRLFELALELELAGRLADAELLARLVATLDGQNHVQIELSEEELGRRLDEAEADIVAGRVTPNEVVRARVEARRMEAERSNNARSAVAS